MCGPDRQDSQAPASVMQVRAWQARQTGVGKAATTNCDASMGLAGKAGKAATKTRSASAGFFDELKEKLEGAVGEIEEPFDAKKKDPGQNQEKKPAESSSTSPKSGKDIASGSTFKFMCPLPKEPEKLPKTRTNPSQ